MGGFMAIHAAADARSDRRRDRDLPGRRGRPAAGLRSGRLDFAARPDGPSALDAWLAEHDLRDAVELMAAKPLS